MNLHKAVLYIILCGILSNISGQGWVELPSSLAEPNTPVNIVLDGLAYSEGPAFDSSGNLFISEDPEALTSTIWKITPQGAASIFLQPSNGSNGLEFDPEWNMVVCLPDQVVRIDENKNETILAQSSNEFDLGKVNDLSISSSGSLYFTNLGNGSVFFLSDDGQLQEFSGFSYPNGIEWIEERGFLYLNAGGKVSKFDVNSDGTLSNRRDFVTVNIPDGLTTDENGNVYIASFGDGAVMVYDSSASFLGKIVLSGNETLGKFYCAGVQGNVSNCVFGGVDNKTLYITGDGGCFSVQLKVAGRLRPVNTTRLLDRRSGVNSTEQFTFIQTEEALIISNTDEYINNIRIDLFSPLGRKLWTESFDHPGQRSLRLNLTGQDNQILSSGWYFLSIYTKEKLLGSKAFLINR